MVKFRQWIPLTTTDAIALAGVVMFVYGIAHLFGWAVAITIIGVLFMVAAGWSARNVSAR